MERRKRPYSIHKRPAKQHRHIYYVKFRDATGAYRSAVSSGCTRRDDAVRWAEARLAEVRDRTENITLVEYAKDFWSPSGRYAVGKTARGGVISRGYLDIAAGITRNHLLPAFGDLRLRDLTAKKIDSWLIALRSQGPLAPATINKLLQVLRTILSHAVADGWLSENPAEVVRPVLGRRAERGILRPEEALRLLADPEPWRNYVHYTINVLAATTGARMGEVRGLAVQDVKPDHVEIHHSWEEGYGLKSPKNGSIREVPITPRVRTIIVRLIEETQPQTLLFYGKKGKNSPLSKSCIENNLAGAMRCIGISTAEQR